MRATVWSGFVLVAIMHASPALAFTPAGHKVLEVMAYRELGQGPAADADALAFLMRDGEIEPAVCLDSTSDSCKQSYASDPLSWWPAPRTDTPDMILARQFSHVGQCFHFMGQQDDESTVHYGDPADPRSPHVSYELQWTAYLRCARQLESLRSA